MIQKPFTISHGEAIIHGDIRYADHASCPILLIIHGFQGSKNWGFFPTIAEEFAKSGSIVISWNMSLNGYSKDAPFIDLPDDFSRNTITHEIADTDSIIDSVLHDEQILSSELRAKWNGEIHVLGHSRGGGIGILISEKYPFITKLALWNSISRFGRFTERQKNIWSETGIFPVQTLEDGTKIVMHYSYIQDLEAHGEAYSPLRAIHEILADILIVHADQDITVPIREAYALKEQSQSARLYVIKNSGHIFGSTHPFTLMTPSLKEAIDITTAFFSS